jgi:hypothetical protein
MVQDWVLLVMFLLGWVVGWIQATGKVNFLSVMVKPLQSESQKVLAQKVQMYQVLAKQLESKLVRAEAQDLVLQSALDSAQVRVQDSELELVRVKAQLERAELALEELRYRSQETDWKGHH